MPIKFSKVSFGKNTDAHDALVKDIGWKTEEVVLSVPSPKQTTFPDPTTEQEEFKPYNINIDNFPEVLRSYILQGISCHDIYPHRRNQFIMSVISMLCSVAGSRYYVNDGDTRMYGNEWLIVTAPSGAGKSYAVGAGLSYLGVLDKDGYKRWLSSKEQKRLIEEDLSEGLEERAKQSKIKDFTLAKKEEWKEKIRALKQRLLVCDGISQFHRRNTSKIDGGTIEGSMTVQSYRRGTTLCCEEIDSWWANLQKSTGSKDPAPYLVALHRSPHFHKELAGGNSLDIAHPCLGLSITGVPQSLPACFREHHIRSGFLSRFLYSYEPKTSKGIKFCAPKSYTLASPHHAEIALYKIWEDMIKTSYRREIIEEKTIHFYDATLGYKCKITQEADEEANRFADSFLVKAIEHLPEEWASAVSERWKDHVTKIAMNICSLRSVHESGEAGKPITMTAEDVIAASEIVRHSITCERFCIGSILKNTQKTKKKTVAENSDVVLSVIKRLQERYSFAVRSKVSNNSNLSGGVADLDKAVAYLMERDLIEVYQDGRKQCYKIKDKEKEEEDSDGR
jgi:hypothetical protein